MADVPPLYDEVSYEFYYQGEWFETAPAFPALSAAEEADEHRLLREHFEEHYDRLDTQNWLDFVGASTLDRLLRQALHYNYARAVSLLLAAGAAHAFVVGYPRAGATRSRRRGRTTPSRRGSAARAHGVGAAIHLEPYEGRHPTSVRRDLEYLVGAYGDALHRMPRRPCGDEPALPVVYVYDAYHNTKEDWAELLCPGGARSIRGTAHDVVAIATLLDARERALVDEGCFDGFYTYFATEGFTFGSTARNWAQLATWARERNLHFSPSVGPGYNDTRVRPWNRAATRDRADGRYYAKMLRSAATSGADMISITSFNEWGEGTQIEPAAGPERRAHRRARANLGLSMVLACLLPMARAQEQVIGWRMPSLTYEEQRATITWADSTCLCGLVRALPAGAIAGALVYGDAATAEAAEYGDGWTYALALTLAGLERVLPVSESMLAAHACLAALPVAYDWRESPVARTREDAYAWAVAHLLPRTSNDTIFNLNKYRVPTTGRVRRGAQSNATVTNADYAVQRRAFTVDLETHMASQAAAPVTDPSAAAELGRRDAEIMASHYAPLFGAFGWSRDETSWTNVTSKAGGTVFCSFASPNLSFWSLFPLPGGRKRARPLPRNDRGLDLDRGKTYVTFMTNEGDTPRIIDSVFSASWASRRDAARRVVRQRRSLSGMPASRAA
ncbi:glycoprotein endo-alpha-1,2-mannosidase-like protein [Aureococcus anophagefferens]|nr:glycoprotein endo-alpha-1,2-mannosidase-like protein [Aureococcus anophagefferens]